jgi:hypothetical protein
VPQLPKQPLKVVLEQGSAVARTFLVHHPPSIAQHHKKHNYHQPLYPFTISVAVAQSFVHDGRRAHEIPPSQPVLVASRSSPAKPRNVAIQARIDNNYMAQGEGSTEASGEAGDAWEEEYRGNAAASAPDILRIATASVAMH